MTVFAWIFFRAENIGHALGYIQSMFTGLFHKSAYIQTINFLYWTVGFALPLLIFGMLIMEWLHRQKQHGLEIAALHPWLRRLIYILIIVFIILFSGKNQQFIYFQF
jgi:bacteriorhodopsin